MEGRYHRPRLLHIAASRKQELFEDGVEQEISKLSNTDTLIAIGIVFDTRLEPSRQAVAQFLKTAKPDDELLLVVLDGHAELLADLLPTRTQARNLTFTAPNGNGKIGCWTGSTWRRII